MRLCRLSAEAATPNPRVFYVIRRAGRGCRLPTAQRLRRGWGTPFRAIPSQRASTVRECAGITPDERGHNDGVQRLARDALVALVALVLWPLTVALGLGVLSTRAWRREPLFSQRDVVWFGRGAVVSAGAVLTLWLV